MKEEHGYTKWLGIKWPAFRENIGGGIVETEGAETVIRWLILIIAASSPFVLIIVGIGSCLI